jgi:hypothetical protein
MASTRSGDHLPVAVGLPPGALLAILSSFIVVALDSIDHRLYFLEKGFHDGSRSEL